MMTRGKRWLAMWATFGLVVSSLTISVCRSAERQSLNLQTVASNAVKAEERFWKQIGEKEPYPTMGIRKVFAYALALSEARQYPERLERLFDIAARDQDRDAESRGYGNFRWTWRDEAVTDRNAVEFCMQDAVMIWKHHRNWVPESARLKLRELLVYSVEGCLRHRVSTSYTNIAILNAGNLIALGEMFDRPDAAEEGYRRLDAICLWTWQYGTHEYCSPTYYGVDLDGLLLIEATSGQERAREQARALLELFWTDLAVNWWPPAERLAGPHSRSYDYLQGLGFLDRYPWYAGWFDDFKTSSISLLRPLRGKWSPPSRLKEMCDDDFPRLVRQSWGIKREEMRTHQLYRDVTLGCAGATYGLQDMALTVDLPGDRSLPRCYFIPDGRQDPYGKVKYEQGSARHRKALHLAPFWAAAQRTCDAVGLVVYRDQDLAADVTTDVQSHFVLRKDVDAFLLHGKKLKIGGGTPEQPVRIPVAPGETLILREGTAAVGIRIPWARTQEGKPASIALVDDGNPWGVVRLTVEHRSENRSTEPAAAIWVRVGSGLKDDAAFAAWQRKLEDSRPATIEANEDGIHIAVTGVDGPIRVTADAPFGKKAVTLVPEPQSTALELNGRELGRPMLERVEPVRSFAQRIRTLRPITVPAEGRVDWEAESGIVFPGMEVAEDAEASDGRYVWNPPESDWANHSGSVSWTLNIARAGRYWLWGRVYAPNPESDSFYVVTGDERPANENSWHTTTGDGWRWRPVAFDRSKQPAPLDLEAGPVELRFRVRESGTKIDRLFLTSDANAKPE